MSARRLLMASGGSGGFPDWTRGTLSAGGSPVTIRADGSHNAFPGVIWLDATRVLLVFRRGTAHLTGGEIYGMIGTVSGSWTFSWGSAFLIYTNAEDVRLEDAVATVDGQVVIAARLYNGTANHSPFLLICDDAPASLTSSSTWGSPITIPLTTGAAQNLGIGHVRKLIGGTYLVGFDHTDSPSVVVAGVLLSASLTDWSAMTEVTIGSGANRYTELSVIELASGTLIAHIRTEVPLEHFVSTSTDHGATWTAPSSLFAAWGLPTFARLTTGLQLAVHRQASSPFQTYWRQSADDGATWTSETLLDGTLIGGAVSDSAYATLLQLDSNHALCIYAIEDSADYLGSPANLYSQVFTDSSTR